MGKDLLNKYKIRDYYMIPIEIVDNVFYEFETQLKNQKEINKKAIEYINNHTSQDMLSDFTGTNYIREYICEPDELLDILKEVQE